MEQIYQIIIEYKNLHPLRFWTGIALTLGVIGLIITLLRKRSKIDNQNANSSNSGTQPVSPKPKQKIKDVSEKVKSGTAKSSKTAHKDYVSTTKVKTRLMYNYHSLHKDYVSTTKVKTPQTEVKEPTATYKPPVKEKPNPKPGIEVSRPKSKPKEDLPKAKVETLKAQNEILKVNYISLKAEQTNTYPLFRYPKQNTVVRSYRIGTTKRRGYKEEVFQSAIGEIFGNHFIVSGELRINTGKDTRPFEPDIALIDKKNNSLRVDIEIDEPYAGITRQPTHCKGDETMRDTYFVDRGWIVIRFSEYQVHMFEKDCLRFISEVIKSVSPTFIIPSSLSTLKAVENENLWDTVQAQKWEKERYREEYLNHEFRSIEEKQETIERDFNEQEQNEEKLVKPSLIGVVDQGKILVSIKKMSIQEINELRFIQKIMFIQLITPLFHLLVQ